MRNMIYFLWSLVIPTTIVAGGSSSSSSSSSKLDKPFTASFSRLNHAACVSLFYRNGRMGCGTSDRSLQIGRLKYFDGSNVPNTKEAYVAVMEDYKLRKDPLGILKDEIKNGYLQGVLVLNSTSNNKAQDVNWYSPDGLYPQGYGTPSEGLNYGNYKYSWNSVGSGIIEYDLHGLPIAYVKESEVSGTLRQVSQSESVDADIVAEFNYYMGPQNMNSLECLAWRDVSDDQWSPKCLPLGGNSIWASAGPPPGANNNGAAKPIFVVSASIDSTGFFHDMVPGANSAASNILTLLMAAKLIGELDDETLGSLNNQIVFGFFQAEAHGFIGSRSFFRDLAYPGFQCNSDLVRAVPRLGEASEKACLDPLYPSVKFADLGQVAGMLSVDQLGVQANDGYFYVHADENNDKYGNFLANILKQLSKTNSGYQVYSSSPNNNDDGYPYPPTPLTSLLSLSEGAVSGAVLTGYDYFFSKTMPYHSFKESSLHHEISLKTIAAAATMVARAAIAAAYDGGNDYNYKDSAAYAESIIEELDYNNGALVALANCLLYNGECADLRDYASVFARNQNSYAGFNVQTGVALGNPPNFYVGVYNGAYGQPFVQVGDKIYGGYDGADFGKKDTDAIGMIPTMLESSIHGLLDDFLGRGSGQFKKVKCNKRSDCANADFCPYSGEYPTCSGGGACVCSRANFHRALDEALQPAKNKPTGYFEVSEDDQGVTPIYTEPFWSSRVGVRVYRDVGPLPGLVTLVVGAAGMAMSVFAAVLVRVGLKKEKLY